MKKKIDKKASVPATNESERFWKFMWLMLFWCVTITAGAFFAIKTYNNFIIHWSFAESMYRAAGSFLLFNSFPALMTFFFQSEIVTERN